MYTFPLTHSFLPPDPHMSFVGMKISTTIFEVNMASARKKRHPGHQIILATDVVYHEAPLIGIKLVAIIDVFLDPCNDK